MTATAPRLVGALITRDGRILLGLRSPDKTSCPNTWDVIGGHVQPHETDRAAIAREVTEEVGVQAHIEGRHSQHNLPNGGVLILYHVTCWTGAIERRNDEHVEIRWFELAEACALPNLAAKEYIPVFRSLSQK
jgi:8-oxo-dGTP diphosphatase